MPAVRVALAFVTNILQVPEPLQLVEVVEFCESSMAAATRLSSSLLPQPEAKKVVAVQTVTRINIRKLKLGVASMHP